MLLAASSVWDPARAAAPGAAFSGLLAAIVVNSALRLAADRDRSQFRAGLTVAPLALVCLLASGYLYILLSGEPDYGTLQSGSASLGGVPPHVAPQLELAPVRNAFLFAIAGSTLGLGAILTLFVVALVFSARHPAPTSIDALPMFSAAAALLVGLGAVLCFLLFGYDDARQAVIAFGGEVRLSGRSWTALLFASALIPLSVGAASEGPIRSYLSDARVTQSPGRAIFALATVFIYCALLPAIAYSLVANVTRLSRFPSIEALSFLGMAWIFLAAGVMGRHLLQRQRGPTES